MANEFNNLAGFVYNRSFSETANREKFIKNKDNAELAGRMFTGNVASYRDRELLREYLINKLNFEAEPYGKMDTQISALDLKKYFDENAVGEGKAFKRATVACYEDETWLMALKAVANLVKPGNRFDLQFGSIELDRSDDGPMISRVMINAKKMETSKTHHSYKILIFRNEMGQRFIEYNICTRVPNTLYKR